MAKRMASVIKSDFIVLPCGMLLTRLYRHVLATQPIAISIDHYLVGHVMVPLTEGLSHRFRVDGKTPHPQTSSGSSSSPSPSQAQRDINLVDNFTLEPIVYID
nr:hypothetical protein [Tanacetum cinerariifolium]